MAALPRRCQKHWQRIHAILMFFKWGITTADTIFMMDGLMMTPSNGNIFRVIGHLCGEFTGPRWIPRTKASDAREALMISLIYVWINDWVYNREVGDLRRSRAHHDVIVMLCEMNKGNCNKKENIESLLLWLWCIMIKYFCHYVFIFILLEPCTNPNMKLIKK